MGAPVHYKCVYTKLLVIYIKMSLIINDIVGIFILFIF